MPNHGIGPMPNIKAGGTREEDAHTGAVDTKTTRMAYIKQLVKETIGDYIPVEIADLSATGYKDAAFNRILTVTGVCRIKMVIEIQTSIEIAGTNSTMSLGVVGATSDWIAPTDESELDGGKFWGRDAQGVGITAITGKPSEYLLDFLVDGGAGVVNVGYTFTGGVATAGAIVFHCFVSPISDGAGAVEGSGEAT